MYVNDLEYLMKRLIAAVLCLMQASCAAGQDGAGRGEQPEQAAPPLVTVAESSNYEATGTLADATAFMDALAAECSFARRMSMGKSAEGRDLPMLILAEPPVGTAEEARRAQRNRLVVFMIGSIHGGEIAGKEALLSLAREIATAEKHPLLKDLVLVFAPVYNADGHEQFGLNNRPGQVGPARGMGRRENVNGMDLNRDFVKATEPETRALLKFTREWNPDVFIDMHTTNGSLHRYLVTYDGPKSTAGDPAIVEYMRDEFFPELSRSLEEQPHEGDKPLASFFYGNFAGEHTRWETFPAEARYSTTYFGLRGRPSVLVEAYSYATFEERVKGSHAFVRRVLEQFASEKSKVRELIRNAGDAPESVSIASKPAPMPEKFSVRGYVEEQREGRAASTGVEKGYEVEYIGAFESTRDAARPDVYLIDPRQQEVIDTLRRHGIDVSQLREDIELSVEIDTVRESARGSRPFQGRNLMSVEASRAAATRRIPAGTVVVRTEGELGRLAVYMLEAAGEDSLARWGLFDSMLSPGDEYPVMRVPDAPALLTGPLPPLPEDRADARRVTYDVVYGRGQRPRFDGDVARGFSWVDDKTYRVRREGDSWLVDADTGRMTLEEERAAASDSISADEAAEALALLPGISDRDAERISRRPATSQGGTAVYTHNNDLYAVVREGDECVARRLTNTPGREELVTLNSTAEHAAFVMDNDLHVVEVSTGSSRALTTGGSDTLRRGKNDWVYFEEVFGRNWRAYWWSPDGSWIAFLEQDSQDVPSFTITDDRTFADAGEQTVERVRYPRAGETNPVVRLGMVSVTGGDVNWADVSAYAPQDRLITGVTWSPESDAVFFYPQNRVQSWYDVCTLDVSGATKSLYREKPEFDADSLAGSLAGVTDRVAWLEPPSWVHFLGDGSYITTSERTGWKRLERRAKDGKLVGTLTPEGWEVGQLVRADDDFAYVTGSVGMGGALFKVPLEAGQGGNSVICLTPGDGSHSGIANESGTRIIDTWSTFTDVTRVRLIDAEGNLIRTLDTNPTYEHENWELGRFERATIPTRDGRTLNATILKPHDFNEAKVYPVWTMTYAGPHAPTLRDRYSVSLYDEMLAEMGIIVFRVDPGPASGEGMKSAWRATRQLGVEETRDLEDAVRWLTAHPWADAGRVGLAGHSYGGYITAYAMTHSKAFSAGIAGAPVTDWREYDTIYTERYMGTPQENPAGYKASSAVEAAADLHGRILVIHGALDDNVHLSNTIKFAEALQRENKQFELMIYPNARHGIGGAHYDKIRYDFIRKTMLGEHD